LKLEKTFNELISDFAVLYFKLHRFHWFVEGIGFYTFHKVFEDLYDETTDLVDSFAERLLSIKGTPVSTLKEFLSLTSISEDGSETCPKEISKTLIADYENIVKKLKDGIELAEEVKDTATSDLFTVTITAIEKNIWMLSQVIKQK